MSSVNAIARRSNIFTVEMIAKKFNVSTSAVRTRLVALKIKPVAKILTGVAGHPALAFDAESVERIGRALPRVIPL
jgi:hypothetical protein